MPRGRIAGDAGAHRSLARRPAVASISVVWPTSTPATSVIALSGRACRRRARRVAAHEASSAPSAETIGDGDCPCNSDVTASAHSSRHPAPHVRDRKPSRSGRTKLKNGIMARMLLANRDQLITSALIS